MASNRRTSYKTPPSVISDPYSTQEARRAQALEEQKRKRLQRVDSSRNLDLFAGLSLGHSDDDDRNKLDGDGRDSPDIVREGVGHFASMMAPSAGPSQAETSQPNNRQAVHGRKSKGKGKQKNLNQYADLCMYAELFNMKEDDAWSESMGDDTDDGLPDNLESWIAVAPVPVGKRCLAVTYEAAGVAGVAPNTVLRSRVLGKRLLAPFPSSLPPSTILDCILDQSWRQNGILHVLDVIRWKGQEIADCETPFRFWWRDTRLSELARLPLATSASLPSGGTLDDKRISPAGPSPTGEDPEGYRFPYPNTLLPIPYHAEISLPTILSTIIPLARSSRHVSVNIPTSGPSASRIETNTQDMDSMQLDYPSFMNDVTLETDMVIQSDGLLLYVAEACYEPGTSPLSAWVPISNEAPRDLSPVNSSIPSPPATIDQQSGPLAIFESLVVQRLLKRKPQLSTTSTYMET